MQIFRKLAGYSFGRADIVRRAMSKKKKDVMEREREYFIYGKKDENGNVEVPGCIRNGVSEEAAKEIYDDMATFAQYAFNKSHAACYAYLAYYSAYLKCHYPRQYMASLLSSVINSTDKVMEYINSCKKMGVNVERPDVNSSLLSFTASDTGIVFGLMAIKNVGEGFVKEIVKKRQTGNFTSLEDFLTRMSDGEINKRMVESLIKAGALDGLGGKKRSQLLAVFNDAIDALQRRNHRNVEGQFDMFSAVDQSDDDVGALNISYPDIPELSSYEKLAMEKEMTGLYLSGHPLERYAETARKLRCDKLSEINSAVSDGDKSKYRDGRTVTLLGLVAEKKEKITKSDTRMAFVNFEDETGGIELIVFPNVYEANLPKIQIGKIIGVTGEISVKESQNDDGEEQKEEPKILVRSIFDVKEGEVPVVEKKQYTPPANDDGKKVRVNLSALMGTNTAPVQVKETEQPKKTTLQDLYLKIPSENSDEMRMAQSVLEIYNYGKQDVYIYFDDTKKLVRALDTHSFVTETMIETLSRILGKENVKLKDKK